MPSRKDHRPALETVVVGAALIGSLSACGNPAPVVLRGKKVPLSVDEYRILPQVLRIRRGRVKLVVRNTGRLTHNVKVEGEHKAASGEPIVFGGTPTAHPGQTVTGKLTLKPGRYRLVCTLANHADLGQTGVLIVR